MEDLKTVVPCKREFEYKASSATDELRRFARPEIEAFNWSKRASSLPTVKAQGSPLCFLTVHAQHFKEYGLGFIEAWITDSCQCFGVDGLVSFNFRFLRAASLWVTTTGMPSVSKPYHPDHFVVLHPTTNTSLGRITDSVSSIQPHPPRLARCLSCFVIAFHTKRKS
ncbi:hypothetical protein Ahy_B01g053011 isoform B [Arachis hypogaea]|uniref:Uncharacterized protein n=1 Tax=Arachis hypogaea TaxID=3818 RepID=A0A445AQV0_ARAHY|nr:hypothetical protein Ahy_B01g053011 isoform B [Arachis hypogaea]